MPKRTDPLNDDELREGVRACCRNAERFRVRALQVNDVDPALAVALACFRVEELAKAHMLHEALRGVLPKGGWSALWSALASHEIKWGEFKYVTMNAVKGWTEDERRKHLRQASSDDAKFKDLGLYVDHVTGQGWREPTLLDIGDQVPHALGLGDSLLDKLQMGADYL